MQKLSDEELVSRALVWEYSDDNWDYDLEKELLSCLSQGRKAMEAMGKVVEIASSIDDYTYFVNAITNIVVKFG